MFEAAHEAEHLATAGVGEGHGRPDQRQEQRRRARHRTIPNMIAVLWMVQNAPSDPTA